MRLHLQLPFHQRRHSRRGLTMPELMMVIAILAILMVVSFQAYSKFREKAEMADSLSKLKNMYVGVSNYVADKHDWPHEPEEISHEGLGEWWMDVLKPYGLSTDDWFSTAHLRRVNLMRKASGETPAEMGDMSKLMKIPSFLPAQFDDYEMAFAARNQPWVMETGEYHGDDGVLVVMPDGTVQTMPSLNQMAAARGKK